MICQRFFYASSILVKAVKGGTGAAQSAPQFLWQISGYLCPSFFLVFVESSRVIEKEVVIIKVTTKSLDTEENESG